MKKEISSLELGYVVKELQFLIGAKIDKIHQPGKKDLILQMHVSGKGKILLRIEAGKFILLTRYKPKSPNTPFGFCMSLRKHLGSARLRSIEQIGFERIVKIVFETKEKKFNMYAELFGKGNIVLCNEEGTIISAAEVQRWKDRTVAVNKKYEYPRLAHNFLDINEKGLGDMLSKSDKGSVVKALALDIGLGGVYAEELCLLGKIDKNRDPKEISKGELKLLFDAAKKLRNKKESPLIIYEEGKEMVKDIVPVELEIYSSFEFERFRTFNEALDSVLTEVAVEEEKKEKEKVKNKEMVKIQKVIDTQTKQIETMKKGADENQRIGELIYENYSAVKEILDVLKKAREEKKIDEAKEQLKDNNLVKEIKEKEGKVVLEL